MRRRGIVGLVVLGLIALIWLLFNATRPDRTTRRSTAEESDHPVRNGNRTNEPGTGTDNEITPPADGPYWTVRVRVLDGARPVAGADVTAFGPEQLLRWSNVLPAAPLPAAQARTTDQGVATITVLRGGRWTFVARSDGFAPGRAPTTLSATPHETELTVKLRRGTTLRGRVLDEAGRLLAGALVTAGTSLGGLYPFTNSTTRTNEQGEYELTDLPPTLLQVAPGEPYGHPVTVRCPFAGRCDLVLRARGAIAGKITDADSGSALANVRIRVEARGSTSFDVTDDDGSYRCANLRPGEVFRIAVLAEGYVPVHPSGVVGPADGSLFRNPSESTRKNRATLKIPIRAGDTTTYDIALRRGARLTGVVRGPDGSLAGAEVRLITNRAQNGYLVPPVRTDANGRFTFAGVMDGPVLVRASFPGHYDPNSSHAAWHAALRGTMEAKNRVEIPRSGVVEHDVSLARGLTVTGRALESETPIAGAHVFLKQPHPKTKTLIVVTKTDGTFQVDGIIPQHPATISCSAPGLISPPEQEVDTGKSAPEVIFRLDRLPELRGRVTDRAGAAIPNAEVLLQQRGGGGGHVLQPTLTDAAGSFVRSLRAVDKPFQVVVRAAGFVEFVSASQPATVSQTKYELNAVLERGTTLRGIVLDRAGKPIAGAHVRVKPERSGQYSWHIPIHAATDKDGSFAITAVPPACVTLLVSAFGYRPVERKISAPEPTTIELERAQTIAGVVRDGGGAPVPGVTVVAYAADKKRFDIYFVVRADALRSDGIPGPARARTDAEGRFVIPDLGAGHYRLHAAPGSKVRVVGDVVVATGQEAVVLRTTPAATDKFSTLTDEDLGRSGRYRALRQDHKKAIDVWRVMLARDLDTGTRVTTLLELSRSLAAIKDLAEWESSARAATRLAPASTADGLRARGELARAILARGRATEALTLANEVAAGTSVDARAAARGDLAAGLSLIAMREFGKAETRLEALLAFANKENDRSLAVLTRNALRTLVRERSAR